MKVEYSKRALADLRTIAAYFASAGDPRVADAVATAIRQTVDRIARHPESGRPVVQRPGLRVVLLPRHRYKIFYATGADAIRVVHIRHTSRRPWP
jgi:plasmid stabilization system protein ParE